MRNILARVVPAVIILGAGGRLQAFEPPLTAVQARLRTNDFTVTVEYEVLDPQRGSSQAGRRRYEGTSFRYWVVPELRTGDGVVAWRAASAGASSTYETEVGYAVYDPARGSWVAATRNYEGTFLAYWQTANLRVTNGLVAWTAAMAGSGSQRDAAVGAVAYDAAGGRWVRQERLYEGSDFNYWVPASLTVADRVLAWKAATTGSLSAWEVAFESAVYDPARAVWARGRWSYDGTSLSYWIPTNLVVSDRIVAWQADTAGLVSPFNKEVGCAVYDPSRRTWIDTQRAYDGDANDPWSVSGLAVSPESVGWTATRRSNETRETRGYDQATGAWDRGSNSTWAAFATSTNRGPAPLAVWFSDMSLGAGAWFWDFGDGTNATTRSPYHVFYRTGEFTVTLTVSNAGSTNSTNAVITVDPGADLLRFEVSTLRVSGGQVRVSLTGMSESRALIVQASSNLLTWRPVWTNPPSPGPVEFTETLSPQWRTRFYRAAQP